MSNIEIFEAEQDAARILLEYPEYYTLRQTLDVSLQGKLDAVKNARSHIREKLRTFLCSTRSLANRIIVREVFWLNNAFNLS